MDTNPYAPPTAVVADAMPFAAESAETPFFPVSVAKLLVLSICTLGLYEVYWFYKNWQRIKAREGSDISPVPRALFSVFYCYPCFARIRDFEAPTLAKSALAAGPLATAWIITTLLHKLPDPFWLVSMFAVGFVAPVQAHANRINAACSPDHDPNSRFSFWNWVAVVLGSLFVTLAVFATLFPSKA